jgi:cellulose synthase/poly-beta-1,6-N-acetylglucosamine synthase-like glycosyltransferase/putative flippase GtrA
VFRNMQPVRNQSRSAQAVLPMQPLTSIIVPVLNESDNVLPLVQRVQAAMAGRPTEILFVDDSRDDLTVKAIQLAKLGYQTSTFDVRVYHRVGAMRHGGLSGAVTDGFKQAQADQVIVMDGDLQHPPETIPAMVEAALHYDMVVASRYRKGGSADGLSNGIRHIVSRGSTLLAKAFFPIRLRPVTDPMTGFFLVNRKRVDTTLLRPKGFKILLEIVASHPKLTITEVPLKFAERLAGESHGTVKQGLEFFSQLLSLRMAGINNLFARLPKFVQFGAIGGSVFTVGMAMLYILVDKLGWSPLAANALQLAVTFGLNYLLNRHITWKDRKVSNSAANKFFVSRAATSVVNYYLFAWLISLQTSFMFYGQTIALSVNYLVANIICLVSIMMLNYVVSDRWAFAEDDDDNDNDHTSSKPRKQRKLVGRRSKVPAGTLTSIAALSAIAVGTFLNAPLTFSITLAAVGLALFSQAGVEVWRMMYAYREPDAVDKLRFPVADHAEEKFCIIVPARHEAAVLAGTLQQLAKQTHPSVQIVSVMCDDDYDTLRVAYDVAKNDPRITVIQYPLQPGIKPSKPKQLNYVLSQLKDLGYSVVGVVDAEDTVHPDLLMHIDAAFRDKEVGIVQGGVQLMNHDSSWYSLHNVLEYYRWFNSAMAFQADNKFMPLGGNTIFLRRELLERAGGWPETLTEDCSLGVLLSTRFQEQGAKTAVYYEARLATREETPDSLEGLFRQRVRWNQGFFHEWRKGIWHELPSLRQRLLAGYVLLGPVILASISIFLFFTLLATIFLNAPVGLVMLMYIPLIPVTLLMILNGIFLNDFGKAFDRKIRAMDYVKLFGTYFIYQFVLNAAAFWSIIRELRGDQSWYKTPHSGQHRLQTAYASADTNSNVTSI